jgi:lipopolysaccharide transport system ATP-binding protein
MSAPVVFDRVWKRFTRGERHDSLRDLVPALARRIVRRQRARRDDELSGQQFWALKDVSFSVDAGEALGIVGRNGAGKSTVLKLLTRILKPTRGSAVVAGRCGALIEVTAGFHPDLTGRENIYLQGAVMGMRRAEITARFDEIVAFAELERFIDTPVKRYSSGMHARLGFSISAHLNPDVLLIDEVLAVGDMAFQERCQARMKRFRDEGAAIVFVSHHLPAVAQLCSQALLLDQGSTVCLGPPADVVAAYSRGAAARPHEQEDVSIAANLERPAGRTRGDGVDVRPGDALTLDVVLDFRADVERATIGVVVWDLRRELYVYGASSNVTGIPPIRAKAGQSRRFAFTFDANLTRGLYAVEVNVVDPDRHRFLAVARGICHFHVVEDVSYDGVANLYLRGMENVDGVRAAC